MENLIKASGYSYKQIAEWMGISTQHLYRFRKKPALMSLEQAERMADILNVHFEVIQKMHQETRGK